MEDILRELIISTTRRLNYLNVEFSETMQPYFDKELRDAVERMVEEGRTSEGDLQIAKDNFNILIAELAKTKEKQYNSDKEIIRFISLNESRMSICPLWPIC